MWCHTLNVCTIWILRYCKDTSLGINLIFLQIQLILFVTTIKWSNHNGIYDLKYLKTLFIIIVTFHYGGIKMFHFELQLFCCYCEPGLQRRQCSSQKHFFCCPSSLKERGHVTNSGRFISFIIIKFWLFSFIFKHIFHSVIVW